MNLLLKTNFMGYRIMKKSLLALAIAALAASSAASAATVYDKDGTSLSVYGRVQGVVYSTHANGAGANEGDSTIVASGRLGFDMRTQLTPGIAGFAKVEWEMADGQDHPGFEARYAWVGADFGQFGQVKAGTFEDAVKYVLNTTDIFDDWGCVGQAGNDDRRDGMVMYSWSGYGFDANISYGASQRLQQVDGAYFTTFGDDEALPIEGSFAVSAGYTSPDVLFGPIAVRLGYGYVGFSGHNATTEARSILNGGIYDNYNQYAAAVSWGSLAQGPYVAALYQMRDFDLRKVNGNQDSGYSVSGVEVVAGYGFANGVSIRTGWEWQNVDFDAEVGDYDTNAYAIPVYVNYQINPNFNVWAEARFDVGTDDKKDTHPFPVEDYYENVYSVGARFTF